jgi:hypothetical protein
MIPIEIRSDQSIRRQAVIHIDIGQIVGRETGVYSISRLSPEKQDCGGKSAGW